MAVELDEVVAIAAPINRVWRFLMSPQNIVACMPGAELTEIIDEQHFRGTLKMRVGAVSAAYAGTVTYQRVDEADHTVVLVAQAEDNSGGTAAGTITSKLSQLPNGETEVHVRSSIDLTGRLVQVGRGMIDGVAKQVVGVFVNNVKAQMMTPADAAPTAADTNNTGESDALNLLAVVWAAVKTFIRRLFGRAPK